MYRNVGDAKCITHRELTMNDILWFIVPSIILLLCGGIVTFAWYKSSNGWIRISGMFYTIAMVLFGVLSIYITIFGDK